MRIGHPPAEDLLDLLSGYSLQLCYASVGQDIPGSYWGDSEAGLIGQQIWVRADTPVHSVLHEAAHFICMNGNRREALNTNAGGGHAEENGVCFLQVLLADQLGGVGRERMFADMDRWGYTFRLGSAKTWFSEDADDAFDWLRVHGLVANDGKPNGALRDRAILRIQ